MVDLRIKEIKINAFRGIKHEELSLNTQSLILLGQNGTGKSSFVNAFEFLFSSKVASLSGSADIHHDDVLVYKGFAPSDTYVEITFQNGHSIKRTLNGLDYDPEIEYVLPSFTKGSFLLNRKKLLKFIDSQPRQRYDAIGGLFDFNYLDEVENTLRKTTNSFKKSLALKKEEFMREIVALDGLLADNSITLKPSPTPSYINNNFPKFRDHLEDLLVRFNELLKKNNLPQIDFNDNLEDYWNNYQEFFIGTYNIDYSVFKNLENDLNQLCRDYETLSLETLKNYNTLLSIFEASRDYLVSTEYQRCPICHNDIDNGRVVSELNGKIDRLSEDSRTLKSWQSDASAVLKRTENARRVLNSANIENNLDMLITNLEDFIQFKTQKLDLSPFEEVCKKLELLNKEDSENNDLEIINKSLLSLIQIKKHHGKIISLENHFKHSEIVYKTYQKDKKEYIENILKSITERINRYYFMIHGDDDITDPKIVVSGSTGIKLKVHSFDTESDPREYSSEGHLDTLGLCIFLAFVREYNDIPFIVLDDIIATVDLAHKEKVARLLLEEFNDYQIIITTHNKLWYKQIGELSKANRQNDFMQVEIIDWNIDNGPSLAHLKSDTELINKYLDENELHAAANALRRYLENVTKNICLANRSEINFKERYSALDYLYSARDHIEDITRGTPFKKFYDDKFSEIKKIRYVSNMLSHDDENSDLLTNKEVRTLAEAIFDLHDSVICEECGSYMEFIKSSKTKKSKAVCTNRKCKSSFKLK